MGWKSTRYISREEAENMFLFAKMLKKKEKWLAQARELSDEELEDAIDPLGDEPNMPSAYGNYGYNFIVGEKPKSEW